MNTLYHKLFRNLPTLGAPIGLKATILQRIRLEERRAARKAAFIFTPIAALSLAATGWAIQFTLNALSQTGFMKYLSLIFSDTSSVASLWQTFAFSLIDSLPFFALTLLVGALFALAASGSFAADSVRRMLATS
jgi:hypothetical protein